MFRVRVIPGAAALLMGLSLSACSGPSSSFDPTDWVSGDWFGTKTPIPGDRKPVFPQGVPGVPEGVPKELVKGNQQAAADAAETPAPEPAPAAKPAPKPKAAKPAPKPQTASAPAARPTTAPATQPAPQQQSGQATLPWPDDPRNAAPKSAGQSSSQANWPPPDPNTFSR